MDSVTQQSAANAEESASASEELNAQAEELNNMVRQLQALVGGVDQGQAAGHKAVHKLDFAHAKAEGGKQPAAKKAKQSAAPRQMRSEQPAAQSLPLDDKELASF